MYRFALAGLLSALPATALAVPLAFTHQGYLADSSGSPLTGTENLTFSIYSTPSGSSPVWTETVNVEFDRGVYSTVLGSGTALDPDDFEGSDLYLGISVGGAAELPQRSPLNAVPFAIRALDATNVSGGVVDASEVRVGGNVVISSSGAVTAPVSWDDLVDIPSSVTNSSDTLSELSCNTGEVAAYDGGAWVCALAGDHEHAASDITSGFLSIDRIPVGGGADQVARGDHSHAFSELSGKASASQLPTISELGGVAAADLPDGSSQELAGKSCATLLSTAGATGDGLYWIDPDNDGDTSDAWQAWCDMTRNGGGWTLVMQNVKSVVNSDRPFYDKTRTDILVRGGTLDDDISQFDLLVGLDFWREIGTQGRYEVGSTPGTPEKQAIYQYLGVDHTDRYRLRIHDSYVTLGSDQPGMVGFNGVPWTTIDRDQDSAGNNCEANYEHPWWYTNCWSGSIWGSNTGSHQPAAYWTSSNVANHHEWGALWLR